MEFSFSFSLSSVLFIIILMSISYCVYSYSKFYLSTSKQFIYFSYFYWVFVIIMSLLIFSDSSISLFFFWDLLGLSSFFLILYYFNQSSVVGSFSTSLTSRLGDFLFILFLLPSLAYSFNLDFLFVSLFSFVILLVSFTKSAQYPFMGWLPQAMSAPTPVSSLVHSSTLVVAGLILLLNFNWYLSSNIFSWGIIMSAFLSLCFSSILAIIEEDLKKIIAFSTLSQISFCMILLGFFFPFNSLIYAISHAFYKSSLFMGVGYFIYVFTGQQDTRMSGSSFFIFPYFMCLFSFSGLCGVLFTSGSYCKELVISSFMSSSPGVFFLFIFLLSIILTFIYCFKIWINLMSFKSVSISSLTSLGVFKYSGLPLILSNFYISFLSSNFLVIPSLFLSIDLSFPFLFLVFLLVMLMSMGGSNSYYFSSYFTSSTYLVFMSKSLVFLIPVESFLYKALFNLFTFMMIVRSVLFLGILSNHSLFLVVALLFICYLF